ncbi:MAG TPA: DedA family protein [Acidimicrobiales bacterium]|nr:DedA family protein [Acidimicrobiales bacterium]
MIARLLNPILSLHGWEAYMLVGLLVFAEASIMLGFVFPGETAAILGGVLASRGHVNIAALIAVVVICAIAGDSVGYLVGQRWGTRLLETRLLRRRHSVMDRLLHQLNRRSKSAVFLARFTAFLRAVVPGLAGMSSMRYRTFLAANIAGGVVWGIGFCLLGYFVGSAYTKVEHYSGIASDVLLGLLAVAIVVIIIRRRRLERADVAEGDSSVDDRPVPGP